MTSYPPPRLSKIYIIGLDEHGPLKIGHSVRPQRRLVSHLQSGHPNGTRLKLLAEIETLNAEKLEAELHDRLKSRKRSGEWFDVCLTKVLEILSKLDTEPVNSEKMLEIQKLRNCVIGENYDIS